MPAEPLTAIFTALQFVILNFQHCLLNGRFCYLPDLNVLVLALLMTLLLEV